jgi:putative ABC transport system permease protein
MSGVAPLSVLDLVAAALLLVVNGGISLGFRLGLERTLAIAAARMVVQLALVGYLLQLVFATTSIAWTALIALVMVAVAAFEMRARQSRPLSGHAGTGLGALTLLVVGTLVTTLIAGAIIGAEPWHSPRVFLPILGMILGNALTGMALGLETLTRTAASERQGIEARLAQGHSRFQALGGPMKQSLTTAMMPIINAMSVAGVVSLPGMMTGQILAGVDPLEAAKYQIMIMFAISGASALAVIVTAVGGVMLLTDQRARLRLDRLQRSERA